MLRLAAQRDEVTVDPDRVKRTTSAAFVRPALRLPYSVRGHGAWYEAGMTPLRHWREALSEAITDNLME